GEMAPRPKVPKIPVPGGGQISHPATVTASTSRIPSVLWTTFVDNGCKLYDEGNYKQAEQTFTNALNEVESSEPKDPRLATTLDYLGTTMLRQHKSSEAQPLLERATMLD